MRYLLLIIGNILGWSMFGDDLFGFLAIVESINAAKL